MFLTSMQAGGVGGGGQKTCIGLSTFFLSESSNKK